MLRFHAVHKKRPGLALREVDVSVRPGTVLLLSGATGSGKSTLLSLVYAGIVADAGTVEVFGRDLGRLRRSSIMHLRRRMGIIPQGLELVAASSVHDNVALPLHVRAEPQRLVRERVAGVLERLGLTALCARTVADLSLGQQQMIAVARALVAEPDIVVADEPTAHLDNACRQRVLEALEHERGRGCAALIATNDHNVLSRGARLGWSHAAIEDNTLRMIADRHAMLDVRPDVGPDRDIEVPIGHDTDTDPEARGKDALIDDNVVPFPLVVHAGGIAR